MIRFGYAIRVGGDPEIAGALRDGIERGSERGPYGKAASEAVRRVAMMRHTPEEWAQMTEEARVIYGGQRIPPRWAERLLVGYAMVCLGVRWLYHCQDGILERRIS